MIHKPTKEERAALDEKIATVDAKLRDNEEFFALYNKDTGLLHREYDGRRRPMRTREMIERLIRIRAENGQIVPLVPNRAQRNLEAIILRLERAGLPVRVYCLKARKVGASTWIVARGMIRCVLEKHAKVAVLAHTDQTATEVLKMAHVMRDNMPKAKGKGIWQFSLKHQATYHIAFRAPMLGELMIASAQHTGGMEPFRGFTPTYMQMSEASRYPDAQAVCQSALNAIPKIPGTAAFMETTANGDTGDFRDRFWAAWEERDTPLDEKKQSWIAYFVPWFWREGCRWTETVGVGKQLPDSIINEINRTMTEHEKWLLTQSWFRRGRPGMFWEEVPVPRRPDGTWTKFRLIGVGWQPVDYDQLAWRRWTLRDEFNADPLRPDTWGRFCEEFPATPQEAFRASGSMLFDVSAIYEMLERTKTPYFKGELVRVGGPEIVNRKSAGIDKADFKRDLGIAGLLSR